MAVLRSHAESAKTAAGNLPAAHRAIYTTSGAALLATAGGFPPVGYLTGVRTRQHGLGELGKATRLRITHHADHFATRTWQKVKFYMWKT